MGKNKNRDRSQQKSGRTERAQQDAERSAMEEQSRPQPEVQDSPRDVARKHQRRFGHN